MNSPIGWCYECGEPIYKGDTYYYDEDGHIYCPQCSEGHELYDEEAEREDYYSYLDEVFDGMRDELVARDE